MKLVAATYISSPCSLRCCRMPSCLFLQHSRKKEKKKISLKWTLPFWRHIQCSRPVPLTIHQIQSWVSPTKKEEALMRLLRLLLLLLLPSLSLLIVPRAGECISTEHDTVRQGRQKKNPPPLLSSSFCSSKVPLLPLPPPPLTALSETHTWTWEAAVQDVH